MNRLIGKEVIYNYQLEDETFIHILCVIDDWFLNDLYFDKGETMWIELMLSPKTNYFKEFDLDISIFNDVALFSITKSYGTFKES